MFSLYESKQLNMSNDIFLQLRYSTWSLLSTINGVLAGMVSTHKLG